MIDIVIGHVASMTRPSSGDNLLGFKMDLEHAIFQSGLSETPKAMESGDDLSMLNVRMVLPASFRTLEQVSTAFNSLLMDVVYNTFHAAAFAYHRDAAMMRFITAVPEKGLRVTGTVLVTGPAYAEVAASGLRESLLPGGLPPWAA
jgi:hypothetical protein